MKVFLQLLKMRILSVFKGSGKKDKYTKRRLRFLSVLVIYAALCFVGMFGFYFMHFAKNFVEQEVGFAYFSMVAVVMVAIGFVTTVFITQSRFLRQKIMICLLQQCQFHQGIYCLPGLLPFL